MNPFTTPDRLLISRRPQDMRAGIQRLAAIVTAEFGMDPTEGALYCFVSRDCEKMKLLRFETNGWCMLDWLHLTGQFHEGLRNKRKEAPRWLTLSIRGNSARSLSDKLYNFTTTARLPVRFAQNTI